MLSARSTSSASLQLLPFIPFTHQEKIRSLETFFKDLEIFNRQVRDFANFYSGSFLDGLTIRSVHLCLKILFKQIKEIQLRFKSEEGTAQSLENLQDRQKAVENLAKVSLAFKKIVEDLCAFSNDFSTAFAAKLKKN